MLRQEYDIMDRDQFVSDFVVLSKQLKDTEAKIAAFYVRRDLVFETVERIANDKLYMDDGTTYPLSGFRWDRDYTGEGNKFVLLVYPEPPLT